MRAALLLLAASAATCQQLPGLAQEVVSATLSLNNTTSGSLSLLPIASDALARLLSSTGLPLTNLTLKPLELRVSGGYTLLGASSAGWTANPAAAADALALAVARDAGLLSGPPGCAYSLSSCAVGRCCALTARVTVGTPTPVAGPQPALAVPFLLTGFAPNDTAAAAAELPLVDASVSRLWSSSQANATLALGAPFLGQRDVQSQPAALQLLLALQVVLPWGGAGGETGEAVAFSILNAAQGGELARALAGLGSAALFLGPSVTFGLAVPPAPPPPPPPAPPPLPPRPGAATTTEAAAASDAASTASKSLLVPVFIAAFLFLLLVCAGTAFYYRRRAAAAAAGAQRDFEPGSQPAAAAAAAAAVEMTPRGRAEEAAEGGGCCGLRSDDWASARAGAARRDEDWVASPPSRAARGPARTPPPLPPRGPSPLPTRGAQVEMEADGDFFGGRRAAPRLGAMEEGEEGEEDWAPSPRRRPETDRSKKWWWNTALGIRFTTPSGGSSTGGAGGGKAAGR